MEKNKAIIEGILFAKGEPVLASDLAKVLEVPVEEAERLTMELAGEYLSQERGIRIIKLEDSFQMCTDKNIYEALIKYITVPRKRELTDVMLETLAIIAYRQPITKLQIESIRGVSSDHAVNRLIEFGLVEEGGRMKAPGRPRTFKTTDEFLRRFSLSSKDDLPTVDPETLEYIREAVAKETGYYNDDDIQYELDLDDPTKEEIREMTDAEASEIEPTTAGEEIHVDI